MSSEETDVEFWRVRQAVAGMWGAKCPDFDPSCGSCQTWRQFEEMAALAERGARIPEAATDEQMGEGAEAYHEVVRSKTGDVYAAGILAGKPRPIFPNDWLRQVYSAMIRTALGEKE